MTALVVVNPAAVAAIDKLGGVQAALLRVGEAVAERAAASAPKDSGGGAASIHAVAVDDEVRVGPSRRGFYMTLVEVGTSTQPPRPHLRPALDGQYDI